MDMQVSVVFFCCLWREREILLYCLFYSFSTQVQLRVVFKKIIKFNRDTGYCPAFQQTGGKCGSFDFKNKGPLFLSYLFPFSFFICKKLSLQVCIFIKFNTIGDTGYCPAFQQTGEEYGPFDLALIPIGAYEPR
jgi:hypothetical protein